MAKAKSRDLARRDPETEERVNQIERELGQWRERAIPHPTAPLDADDRRWIDQRNVRAESAAGGDAEPRA